MTAALALFGCKTGQSAPTAQEAPTPIAQEPMGMVRKAVAFRTNGDYAHNVMIRVAADGQLIYYPAPTDISADSAPLPLVDGWMLDRQGAAGTNTAFLKYTYAEYAALPSVPSPQQLKAAIIPGAKVTHVMLLPYPYSDAQSHLQDIKNYIKENS